MTSARCSTAFFVVFCFAIVHTVHARDWPQWRGPDRNGVSAETGLLKEWPQGGPKMLWELKDIGSGYSTPAVVGDRLYLLSNEGLENEFVQALSMRDGKRIWSSRLGNVGNPKQNPNFPAARSTPTVDGQLLYALGSDGDLACLETATGKILWQKSLRKEFGGKPGDWAYSESPLIDGNTLVCTPGGSEATLVALNKGDGEVIWKCPVPGGDDAAYTSAIVVEAPGSKEYVQVLKKGIVGVDAKSGKFLWRYDKIASRYGANIPSPVADQGYIYSAGAGTGGALIQLKNAGGSVQPDQVYFSPKLPTAIGGAVKLGDVLYGTTSEALVCFGFKSGDIKWQDRALGAASLCFADGRLYLHGENGQVALVEPSPDGYHEKGRFTPPDQPKRLNDMEKAWAYPVVAEGKLFLRDQGVLWCYDVAARP
jgi:outer membrane protein assembly factor BamB